jgi:hypothetical protein
MPLRRPAALAGLALVLSATLNVLASGCTNVCTGSLSECSICDEWDWRFSDHVCHAAAQTLGPKVKRCGKGWLVCGWHAGAYCYGADGQLDGAGWSNDVLNSECMQWDYGDVSCLDACPCDSAQPWEEWWPANAAAYPQCVAAPGPDAADGQGADVTEGQ